MPLVVNLPGRFGLGLDLILHADWSVSFIYALKVLIEVVGAAAIYFLFEVRIFDHYWGYSAHFHQRLLCSYFQRRLVGEAIVCEHAGWRIL